MRLVETQLGPYYRALHRDPITAVWQGACTALDRRENGNADPIQRIPLEAPQKLRCVAMVSFSVIVKVGRIIVELPLVGEFKKYRWARKKMCVKGGEGTQQTTAISVRLPSGRWVMGGVWYGYKGW